MTGHMGGIFISYRRDDASGHAGRLFDRLAARFGRDHVFMDVTDIAPGEDFTQVIEASVGAADLLLAVIGPQWLAASGGDGTRRLDASADFVRQEIAAAFQRQVRVIPVLVRGARMPREEELPDALKALARRQAVELTDSRWDSDLALFEQALAERMPAPPPARAAGASRRKPGKAVIAAAIAVVGLIAAVAYLRKEAPSPEPGATSETSRSAQAESSQRPADIGQPAAEQGSKPAAEKAVYYALPLPKVARFRLKGQQFEILALRKAPADADNDLLTVLLRMTNTSGYPAGFVDLSALLEADGETIAALSPSLVLVAGSAAAEGEYQFPVARSTASATLSLEYHDEETRIPLSLGEGRPFTPDAAADAYGRARSPQLVDVIAAFPVDLALPSPHSAQLGSGKFTIAGLRLDRYNAERAVLEVDVHASAARDAAGGINFWSDNLRLHVDGVPRAPENQINEVVSAGTTGKAKFEFLLTDVPKRLELSFRSGPWESDRWPIVIPATP